MTDTRPPSASPFSIGLASDDQRRAVELALTRALDERWPERLFAKDPTLWSADPRRHRSIVERLGWIDAPLHFTDQIPALEAFGEGIRDSGFSAAIVAGMGGSSLAPDVLWRTFGLQEGWLELRVLDSTDPMAVAATVDDLDPLSTLFVVSTKSGTTVETLAFQADAWARVEAALRARHAPRNEHAGDLMVAITDPGRSLEALPHHDELREVFLNPPDVGGRYSAMTYVGLAPASLIGLDLDALLASAKTMLGACQEPDPAANPGTSLGVAIAALAALGRDKLTFLADPEIGGFGAWLEQLIAESTGKAGIGIVPIDGEPLGPPASYGDDRTFVRLTLAGSEGLSGADALAASLEAAGHPVIRIGMSDPIDVGGEFVRWEVATAIAGIVLGIDPFDQPNVEEAKERTRRLLEPPRDRPVTAVPLVAVDGLTLYGDAELRLTGNSHPTLVGELRRHLARRKPGAYLALQGFIAPTERRTAEFSRIRSVLLDGTRCATTAGYGPRYLHSTGQLHKGGPPTGWFIQLTADHPVDRGIAGWPYTFGQLIDAQAAGDFEAIEAHDLPILRVHLGRDPDAGLTALRQALTDALEPSPGSVPED
jgi:glucose-6-phosphate isomerase